MLDGWKGIVSAFNDKLIKIIKNVDGRFDDYAISPKIRQLLLHWRFELIENDLWFIFFVQNELLFFLIGKNYCKSKRQI